MKTDSLRQTQIKICGLTKPEQALSCVEMGADLIGLNCWKGSSRYIIPEIITEIASELPESARTVGVFVNESPDSINNLMKQLHLSPHELIICQLNFFFLTFKSS